MKTYFMDFKSEVSKIKWPNKKDMVKYSISTIVFIIFFASYFGLVDIIAAFWRS